MSQCDGCIVADRTQDSNLWVLALSYFAQKEENCRQQLVDVLAHILSLHHLTVVMVALWNRADHYVFILFLLSCSFFPLLISAVGDWMSTILPHMMWP